jgi:hypothetical protein
VDAAATAKAKTPSGMELVRRIEPERLRQLPMKKRENHSLTRAVLLDTERFRRRRTAAEAAKQ